MKSHNKYPLARSLSALLLVATGSVALIGCERGNSQPFNHKTQRVSVATPAPQIETIPQNLKVPKSLTITELTSTPSNGENAPNTVAPPVTISNEATLTIFQDLEALRTPEPNGIVNCPADSGVVYELSFSSPNYLADVDETGCENVHFEGADMIASHKLETDITIALANNS